MKTKTNKQKSLFWLMKSFCNKDKDKDFSKPGLSIELDAQESTNITKLSIF